MVLFRPPHRFQQAVRFELLGPGAERLKCGRVLRKTKNSYDYKSLTLTTPVLRSGTASATFQIELDGSRKGPGHCLFVFGVFPADQPLDSFIFTADGKWCALSARSYDGGFAQVLCDGVKSDEVYRLGWQQGDKVKVEVAFEDATTAHVTLSSTGTAVDTTFMSWNRTLYGVPACGLRFGVGLSDKGKGVTLSASSVEEM